LRKLTASKEPFLNETQCNNEAVEDFITKQNQTFHFYATVNKERLQSGGYPVRTFFGQGSSSDKDVRIFGAKTSDFSKFTVCPHGQEGLI